MHRGKGAGVTGGAGDGERGSRAAEAQRGKGAPELGGRAEGPKGFCDLARRSHDTRCGKSPLAKVGPSAVSTRNAGGSDIPLEAPTCVATIWRARYF